MALGRASLNLIVAGELIKFGSAFAIRLGADEDSVAHLARGCLEAIAYEEASHAVLTIHLGIPIVSLEISALRGRVHPKGPRNFERRYFIVSLAGPIARLRFDPESTLENTGAIDDTVEVKGLVTADDYDALNLQAEELVERRWPEIECVAKAALKSETGRLSEQEIIAAMESAYKW